MFGTEPKVGLASSSIPAEIIERLESEDDLLRALSVPPSDVSTLVSDEQLPASQPDDLHVPPFQPDDPKLLPKSCFVNIFAWGGPNCSVVDSVLTINYVIHASQGLWTGVSDVNDRVILSDGVRVPDVTS